MSYKQFSYVYDHLMSDVPYDKWLTFVQKYITDGASILDVACGTGTITEMLLDSGYHVTGVDLSEEMLVVASDKFAKKGYHIPLFAQNMAELELDTTFDAITIFCDSLNYVTSEDDIRETFKRVYQHLHNDGYFLFDVHSLYKIHHIFKGETFTVNEEDVALIWNCFEGETPDTVEHEMTFFVKNEQELFERFDELHVQRSFAIDTYISWLEEVGFTIESITANYGQSNVEEESDRVFFVAKKSN